MVAAGKRGSNLATFAEDEDDEEDEDDALGEWLNLRPQSGGRHQPAGDHSPRQEEAGRAAGQPPPREEAAADKPAAKEPSPQPGQGQTQPGPEADSAEAAGQAEGKGGQAGGEAPQERSRPGDRGGCLGGGEDTAAARAAAAELAQRRAEREKLWAGYRSREEAVIEKYIEFAGMTDLGWLEAINKNIQSVMETNTDLQEQLTEQDLVVQELQREHTGKVKEWEELEVDLVASRKKQADEEARYREVHEQRTLNERRLRDKAVTLHEKMHNLGKEKARLEDQRREEERQMVRLKEISTKLQEEMISLRLRKAEFEVGSDLDARSMQSAGTVESGGFYSMGFGDDNGGKSGEDPYMPRPPAGPRSSRQARPPRRF